MMHSAVRMSPLLIAVLNLSTTFAAAGYVPIGGHDGVAVYQRPNPVLIDLGAVGEFNAPPEEVQRALLDYDDASRISTHIAESRTLSRRGGEMTVYQHLKLPVISDRDY